MTFQRITFTEDAIADLQGLAHRDQRLVIQAMRIAKKVDEGTASTKQLQHYTKTGDLADCSRVHFGVKRASRRTGWCSVKYHPAPTPARSMSRRTWKSSRSSQ